MKKVVITKEELRDLIVSGISSEELNANYDYSNITDMSYLLAGCKDIKTVPYFDTSNVKVLDCAFMDCENLEYVPDFDLSNGVSIFRVFYGCKSLKCERPTFLLD